jgi:hypothetical protein
VKLYCGKKNLVNSFKTEIYPEDFAKNDPRLLALKEWRKTNKGTYFREPVHEIKTLRITVQELEEYVNKFAGDKLYCDVEAYIVSIKNDDFTIVPCCIKKKECGRRATELASRIFKISNVRRWLAM